MNVHYLMHAPFEGLGSMEAWFVTQGHRVTRTRLYAGETLPDPAYPDWLVVMGGAMSVHDEREYPWLVAEKHFIGRVLARDVPVLGVCLGGQLIAEVLGGAVTKNPGREIGWFPVSVETDASPLLEGLPAQFTAFHWHGETFSIPPGAMRVAASAACVNQAYVYGERVVGLQFHLEVLPSTVADFCAFGADEMTPGDWVQTEAQMRAPQAPFTALVALSNRLLANLAQTSGA